MDPLTDVIVVADLSLPVVTPGHYALVRAQEWCLAPRQMRIWRGPDQREEMVSRDSLREVSCHKLLVDKGFFICVPTERGKENYYSCPDAVEGLKEAIIKEAENILNVMANERAAEGWSYIHDADEEKYGQEIWKKATFGDVTAINGEVVYSKRDPKPPRGYVETTVNERVSSGEEEVDREFVAEQVHEAIKDSFGPSIERYTIDRILGQEFPKHFIVWSSDAGNIDIWVSKRALRAHQSAEERAAKELERKRQLEHQQRQKRTKEERRSRIQKGGYPNVLDWSPSGELPED